MMDDILIKISQYGVLPLLLLWLRYFYLKIQDHLKTIEDKDRQIEEKNLEIREIEKENVGLLYKCLAALEKITKNDEE